VLRTSGSVTEDSFSSSVDGDFDDLLVTLSELQSFEGIVRRTDFLDVSVPRVDSHFGNVVAEVTDVNEISDSIVAQFVNEEIDYAVVEVTDFFETIVIGRDVVVAANSFLSSVEGNLSRVEVFTWVCLLKVLAVGVELVKHLKQERGGAPGVKGDCLSDNLLSGGESSIENLSVSHG